jgi:quercetin dioxygenase-like cupin family protein
VIQDYVVSDADVEAVESDWGWLTWLVSHETSDDAEMTVGVCTIKPGKRNPEHFHPNCEEILFVIEGECDHTLGQEVTHLTRGMMIRCPARVPHYAINVGGRPLRALVCFSAPDRQTEIVEH